MGYGNLTALCVEDEPLVSLDMMRALSEMNFGEVYAAHRLSLAFDLVANHSIDVALLDFDLGFGERTTELGLTLREQGAVVVFASGYERVDLDPRVRHFPFIAKPVRRTGLRALMATLLEGE